MIFSPSTLRGSIFAPLVVGANGPKVDAVIGDHNKALLPDVLTTFSVSYEWRRLMVHMCERLLDRRIWEGTEEEIDNAILKAHYLLLDLYTTELPIDTQVFFGARVSITSNKTITGTETALVFSAFPDGTYDYTGFFTLVTPTRLTIPAGEDDAWYRVTFSGRVSGGTLSAVSARIYLNGSTIIARANIRTANQLVLNADTDYLLSAGDYVEVLRALPACRCLAGG